MVSLVTALNEALAPKEKIAIWMEHVQVNVFSIVISGPLITVYTTACLEQAKENLARYSFKLSFYILRTLWILDAY